MKGELKAGGLALVVRSTDASDIGKCVTLVHMVQPGQLFTSPQGQHCRWLEEYGPAWVVIGDVIQTVNGKVIMQGWACFEPRSLMPIDGDDHQEPDQLAKDKPREVVA